MHGNINVKLKFRFVIDVGTYLVLSSGALYAFQVTHPRCVELKYNIRYKILYYICIIYILCYILALFAYLHSLSNCSAGRHV
jgi:hypothetical protein